MGYVFGQSVSDPNKRKIDVNRLVGPPSEEDCIVEGVMCGCLLDTGSMVTTISEPFFKEHLKHLTLQVQMLLGLVMQYIKHM